MADNMFAESFVNVGGKQQYTVLMSFVVHTLVITAALIAPLVATNQIVLPAQLTMITFHSRPPLPPSPPSPPSPSPRGPATEQPPLQISTVPTEAPAAIVPEIPIQSINDQGIAYSAGIEPGGEYRAPVPVVPLAPVSAQAPMPVGGDIKRPVKIRDVAPSYPALARSAQIQGVVIIEATIGPSGRVQEARVLRSVGLLDGAALDAVRQWEYTPTLLNGVPIAIVMTVTVDFRLR